MVQVKPRHEQPMLAFPWPRVVQAHNPARHHETPQLVALQDIIGAEERRLLRVCKRDAILPRCIGCSLHSNACRALS